MPDAMDMVELVIDRMLSEIEVPSGPRTDYGEMGFNWQKVQSSLKGWFTKTIQKRPAKDLTLKNSK